MISNGKAIICELEKYYTELCRDTWECTPLTGMEREKLTHSKMQTEDLEGFISYKVLTQTAKKMKNNKSSGSDGFPVEFNSLLENHSILNSEVCEWILWWSTIVTCPKTMFDNIFTKSRKWRYQKNWEPVTLLSVIYKMPAACTAGRMKKKALDKIVAADQKGFITGTYTCIRENIRLLFDIT